MSKDEFTPRAAVLTDADVIKFEELLHRVLNEHSCKFPYMAEYMTEERARMLSKIADVGIEVEEDTIKGTKKILKYTLLIIALGGGLGALVAFIATISDNIIMVIGKVKLLWPKL